MKKERSGGGGGGEGVRRAPLNCFASTVIASLTATHTVDLSCVHTRSVRFPRRRGGGGRVSKKILGREKC